MIALSLLDIKMLTTNLFVQDMFDKFYMTEAEITTFAAFHIDGRRRKELPEFLISYIKHL